VLARVALAEARPRRPLPELAGDGVEGGDWGGVAQDKIGEEEREASVGMISVLCRVIEWASVGGYF
jgi:hypothetical protein